VLSQKIKINAENGIETVYQFTLKSGEIKYQMYDNFSDIVSGKLTNDIMQYVVE